MNQIIKNIKTRRSIRKFKIKPIPKKLILEIIEAGRYAPSSHNSQPWRFIAVTNKKRIKEFSDYLKSWFKRRMLLGKLLGFFHKKIKNEIEIAKKRSYTDKDLFLYNAPLVVVICAKPGRFHINDCSLAAQNMMLAAHSLSIGSCWIGFADMILKSPTGGKLRKMLGVPKGAEVVGTIVFGYPEIKGLSARPREKEANIVKWIK
jgi:nitroreductase